MKTELQPNIGTTFAEHAIHCSKLDDYQSLYETLTSARLTADAAIDFRLTSVPSAYDQAIRKAEQIRAIFALHRYSDGSSFMMYSDTADDLQKAFMIKKAPVFEISGADESISDDDFFEAMAAARELVVYCADAINSFGKAKHLFGVSYNGEDRVAINWPKAMEHFQDYIARQIG